MKHVALSLLVPVFALLAPACTSDSLDPEMYTSPGSGGATGSGGSAGSGGAGGGASSIRAPACTGKTLKASPENNYSFSSTLTFPPVEVAAKTELTLDWQGVAKDFMGHALDNKKDLNTILVFLWKLSLADLQVKLNADTLLMKDLVTLPLQFSTNGSDTSAKLFQFSNTGEPTQEQILTFLDPEVYPKERYTYTLMAATGDELGQGTRMIRSFTLSSSKTESTVKMTSDSTKLEWQARLQQAKVTGIPAGEQDITLDWGSSITKNALGNDFDPPDYITKVLVGHYDQSVTELEEKFLDIELIATKLYRGNIEAGTSMSFAALETEDGESFSGIDDTGTWLVALQCGSCRNPAPWYLSVLKPCE